MKTLHLHIGSQKTGTTSIQDTFFQNKSALKNAGFQYPGEAVNHHFTFFATNAVRIDWPRQFNSYNQHELSAFIKKYLQDIEDDLNVDLPHHIISTEYLFLSDLEYIKSYLKYVEPFFDKIKAYVFLRNPVDYYRSLQQQKIKARSYIVHPNHFKYSFKNVIESWRQFCEVEVIGYQKKANSCRILSERIGVPFKQLINLNNKNRSNSSISLEHMLLYEKIQKNLYREQDDIFKSSLTLLNNISPSFCNKPLLQSWVEEEVLRNHADDLDWLSSEYGIVLSPAMKNSTDTEFSTEKKTEENASVKDVFEVGGEQQFERFESLVIDSLLKKLLQLTTAKA